MFRVPGHKLLENCSNLAMFVSFLRGVGRAPLAPLPRFAVLPRAQGRVRSFAAASAASDAKLAALQAKLLAFEAEIVAAKSEVAAAKKELKSEEYIIMLGNNLIELRKASGAVIKQLLAAEPAGEGFGDCSPNLSIENPAPPLTVYPTRQTTIRPFNSRTPPVTVAESAATIQLDVASYDDSSPVVREITFSSQADLLSCLAGVGASGLENGDGKAVRRISDLKDGCVYTYCFGGSGAGAREAIKKLESTAANVARAVESQVQDVGLLVTQLLFLTAVWFYIGGQGLKS